MHQRRPELYGRLTEDVKIWQDYPNIPWDYPECEGLVNQAQLPAPSREKSWHPAENPAHPRWREPYERNI